MPWDIDRDFAWPTAAAIRKVRENVLASAGLVPGTREYEDAMNKLSEKDTSSFEVDESAHTDDHVGGYRAAAVPTPVAPWDRGHWYGEKLPWLGSICLLLVLWISFTLAPSASHKPFMVILLIALSLGCAVFPRVANVYAWYALDEDGKKLRMKVSDKLIAIYNCMCLAVVWCREVFGFGTYGTVGRAVVACVCLPLVGYQIWSGIRDLITDYKRHTAYRVRPATGFFSH